MKRRQAAGILRGAMDAQGRVPKAAAELAAPNPTPTLADPLFGTNNEVERPGVSVDPFPGLET